MFGFLKTIFKRPSLEELAAKPVSEVMKDVDFGYISYEPPSVKGEEGYWQMYDDWSFPEANAKLGCSAIPGDANGPFQIARKFLLSKRDALEELWVLCSDELQKIKEQWYPKETEMSHKDIYFLSSISMERSDSDEWEISFEAKDGYFWTFVSFQIKDNNIVGNTIDT
jgi:hypothetical protein